MVMMMPYGQLTSELTSEENCMEAQMENISKSQSDAVNNVCTVMPYRWVILTLAAITFLLS
jgi:hypothetical protein